MRGRPVHQAHAQVDCHPYLLAAGVCCVLEVVGDRRGSAVSYLAVPCWVRWFRIGNVAGVRLVGLSLQGWLPFWNLKTGEEGWGQYPLSPQADVFRAALHEWGLDGGLNALMGSAFLEGLMHSSPGFSSCSWIRVGGTAGGICFAVGAVQRVMPPNPSCILLWWGRWHSTTTAMREATGF